MGMTEDIDFLESLLDDQTICSSSRVKTKVRQTQIRDVALAAILHLAKQDLKDYGFDRAQPNSNTVFHANSLGFESDEQREHAIDAWREFSDAANVDGSE